MMPKSKIGIGDEELLIDDSSDEENEKTSYSLLDITKYPYTKPTIYKTQKLDLYYSFILQDLGIRLLTSDKVRKIYFPVKSKILGKHYSYNPKYVDDFFEYVVGDYQNAHKKYQSVSKKYKQLGPKGPSCLWIFVQKLLIMKC